MPTTGSAQYNGLSVHLPRNGSPINGTSQFRVDFANKTVTGTVTPDGHAAIGLNAAINGNTFSGTSANGSVNTSGGFYGSQAAEMAGVYSESGQFSGAFGATKQ